jgi:hypothetical protein
MRRVGLAAALVAAIANLFLATDPYGNPDSLMFEALARSLMAGQGLVYREPIFPDLPLYAFRSPGYGVFLALGLTLGGVTGALLLQGALHGLSATLVGSLAGRWAGQVAAWSAFALRFLWPAGWSQAGQLMSEGLLEFLSLLTVWLAVRGGSDRAWRWAAAAGVTAALAVLTRPAGLGFALAAGVWLLVRFPKGALAMAAAALIAWAPWPVRNAMRLNAFVPLVTNGGVTAWGIQSENWASWGSTGTSATRRSR